MDIQIGRYALSGETPRCSPHNTDSRRRYRSNAQLTVRVGRVQRMKSRRRRDFKTNFFVEILKTHLKMDKTTKREQNSRKKDYNFPIYADMVAILRINTKQE